MNTSGEREPLSTGQCASLACLLEATAAKPGNVHRSADFEDLTYLDFAASAMAIGPVFAAVDSQRVGMLVLEAVRATRRVVATNTNLGMLLLLAPLAKVPRDVTLADGIGRVLAELNADDCRDVYEAIRLAEPGGLGEAEAADVHGEPPADLVAAMRLAPAHDLVARQYTNDFAEVLGRIVPWLAEGIARDWPLQDVIVYTHLRLMRDFPDGLIARKCGIELAARAAAGAAKVLDAGEPPEDEYRWALADFDFWLRSDHHRRNPGTTADLIAAGLFAALRDGIIKPPFNFYGAS